jgi:hypothetical protein
MSRDQAEAGQMMAAEAEAPLDAAEEIAFEETRGMTAAEILAGIRPWPGSPSPRLGPDHVVVTGCRGVLAAGGARIELAGLDRIFPWPVQP